MDGQAASSGEETELAEVRRILDQLVECRLVRPLTAQEQEDYDRLAQRERAALNAATSAGRPGASDVPGPATARGQ